MKPLNNNNSSIYVQVLFTERYTHQPTLIKKLSKCNLQLNRCVNMYLSYFLFVIYSLVLTLSSSMPEATTPLMRVCLQKTLFNTPEDEDLHEIRGITNFKIIVLL